MVLIRGENLKSLSGSLSPQSLENTNNLTNDSHSFFCLDLIYIGASLKQFIIFLLAISFSKYTIATPCTFSDVTARDVILDCNGKTGQLNFGELDMLGFLFSYEIDNQNYLLLGGKNDINLNGENIFKAPEGSDYLTTLLVLDPNLEKVHTFQFSKDAATIPGGIKDMPVNVLGFGKYVAVINYFEMIDFRHSIIVLKKSNLTRIKDIPLKFFIKVNQLSASGNSLIFEVSILDSNEEDAYLGIHLPKGFRYWVGIDQTLEPKVIRKLEI